MGAIDSRQRPASHVQELLRPLFAYVEPSFGRSLLVVNVTPSRLISHCAELLTTGSRSRSGGLAPKTVRNVHSMLHKALPDAVRWNHLPRNLVALAEPPKAERPEMKVWSPQA